MSHSPLAAEPAFPPPSPSSFMNNDPESAFHVEDFFNMDLIPDSSSSISPTSLSSSAANAASVSTQSSSSRSSSRSPSGSFDPLPTPQHDPINSFDISGMNLDGSLFANGGLSTIDEESMFNFGYGATPNEYFKPGTDLSHLANVNFPSDLFGSFDGEMGGAATSPDDASVSSAVAPSSASSSTSDGKTTSNATAINPNLVGSSNPTILSSSSEASAEPENNEHEAAEEDKDPLVIPPVKVGGKGAARKGTLHSGGISKKSSIGPQSIFGALAAVSGDKPMSSVVNTAKSGSGKGKVKSGVDEDEKDDTDTEDWRPSPEEYQKMSSKEKRQLRNKISARNFRIRRKEYIHTLEGDIAERDRLINAIRTELGTTKSENNALRQEVAALKKAILEGRASPMLPPPAPLSPLSPLQNLAQVNSGVSSATSSSSNNVIRPNTQKDLPTSPRLAATQGGFWGGASQGLGSLGGGFTPVHTAIIPETSPFDHDDHANENINPALNTLPPNRTGANAQQQMMSQVLSQLYGTYPTAARNGFDAFSEVNPFTLRDIDKYRMQLWGSAAALQAQGYRARNPPTPNSANTSPSQSPNSSPSLSGLASGLRPHYFSGAPSPASPTTGKPLGSLFSSKKYLQSSYHGLPSPPPSPRLSNKERVSQSSSYAAQMQQRERQQQQQLQTHALLATIASQTILQKMGQAFWDAFSGSSSSGPSASSSKAWDAEKVQRVLDGRAELRVVDVPQRAAPAPSAPSAADNLIERMGSLSLEKSEEKDEKKGLLARLGSHCAKQ